MDIGISKADREAIAAALSQVLSDTYALYMKTHGYHWNVEGPQFSAYHTMFMTQSFSANVLHLFCTAFKDAKP